jgi:Histone methylation protein DOT1
MEMSVSHKMTCDAINVLRERCSRLVLSSVVTRLVLSDLVGKKSANALDHQLQDVLRNAGYQDYAVTQWHLIRCDSRATEKIVQDISETATSLLLLVVGMGHVTTYSNASKTAESVKLPLRLDACIAIKCNSLYSLGLTRAVYLHCTCTLKRAFFHGRIYVPLRYACPYKSSLRQGEMRRYPKNFLPNPEGDCKYSGSRWKNILDHLAFCKFNPDIEKCQASQSKRRLHKCAGVQCDLCSHAPFNNKNSLVKHISRHHRPKQNPRDVYSIVEAILSSVSRSDIHQPCGRRDLNTGEMSMESVTKMLAQFKRIQSDDVFVDVGSGIGNVVIQVALESNFRKCIGVEMRTELTKLTESLLASCIPDDVLPGAIEVLNLDICDKKLETYQQLQDATHIFSSNILFTAEALLAIEELVCWLPNVRHICVVQHPCPRHSARCTKPFCHLWIYESSIQVAVTYTNNCVKLWFFKRI